MKRIFFLALAVTLSISLTSCGTCAKSKMQQGSCCSSK
jgi:uncharacterized lipoprotein YehR (DUF1307 family)